MVFREGKKNNEVINGLLWNFLFSNFGPQWLLVTETTRGKKATNKGDHLTFSNVVNREISREGSCTRFPGWVQMELLVF